MTGVVQSGRRERLAWASAWLVALDRRCARRTSAPSTAHGSRGAPRDQHAPDQGRVDGDFARWTEDRLRGARSEGQSQLWLRSLDSPLARPLTGTERATLPFWSPDSRSIGFIADTSSS